MRHNPFWLSDERRQQIEPHLPTSTSHLSIDDPGLLTLVGERVLAHDPPTAAQLAAVPAPCMVKTTNECLRPLPGHPDGGKPTMKSFASVAELIAYSKERMDADGGGWN